MQNLKSWFKTETNTKSYSQTENTAARTNNTNDCKIEIESPPPAKKLKLNTELNAPRKNDELPCFLTDEKIKRLKDNNSWITVENGGSGCLVCRNVKDLGVLGDKNLRLSKVWQNCTVVPNGETADSLQSSLRKKNI